MSESKALKPKVNLKRQVSVKAIVTDGFKQYLHDELTTLISNYTNDIKRIDEQLQTLDQNSSEYSKLYSEKVSFQKYIDSEESQRQFVSNLELNSLYSQGPIESMVTVTVGDNLYEKLGSVEIIVKDSIIQSISRVKNNKKSL